MNNARIVDWVNQLFTKFDQTPEVKEQKEELELHLIEKIKEYMATGENFDQAFENAKDDLGDPEELLANFSEILVPKYTEPPVPLAPPPEKTGWKFRINHEGFVTLSPFIYVALGIFWGWWAWAWVIIPMSAIIFSSGMFSGKKGRFGEGLVALSPFIYVLLGFLLGWWAWGWLIIPGSAIVAGSGLIRISRG